MSLPNDNDYDDDASGELPEDAVARRAEKPMGFFDHLEELRWTLVKCVIVYVAFAVILGLNLRHFHHMLLWPLEVARGAYPQLTFDLGTTGIMESFSVVIYVCCLGALLPSVPFFFFFAAQFIGPALTTRERRMVIPVCVAAFVLFSAGSALSFFIMAPSMLKFSAYFNEMFGFVMRWTPGSYYGTMSWLVIGAGLAFQAPLVILLLVHLGFLRVRTLTKYRRHTFVVILILVMLISPTPDWFSQGVFAAALYLLFELSIILGRRAEKKRALANGGDEDDEDEDEEADEETDDE